jgi:hypothetical protein
MPHNIFPHNYDRYRLFGQYLRMAHHAYSSGDSQTDLTNFINEKFKPSPRFHQSYVSQLESLSQLDQQAMQSKPFSESYAWWLMLALDCSFREAKLLHWLITSDNQVPDDLISRYAEHDIVPKEDLIFDPNSHPEISHFEIVNKLRQLYIKHQCGIHKQPLVENDSFFAYEVSKVEMRSWSEPLSIEWEHFLLSKECFPGQRMLVSKYPSALIKPTLFKVFNECEPAFKWYYINNYSADKNQGEQEYSESLYEMTRTVRMRFFLFNLYHFGERWITSLSSLERYLSNSFHHPFMPSVWERREQILTIVRLLDFYPVFRIGLTKSEPETELVIKSNRWVLQQTSSRIPIASTEDGTSDLFTCGPTHIFWSKPDSVLPVYLEFEREWQKLYERGHTDSSYVRSQLLKTVQDSLSSASAKMPKKAAMQENIESLLSFSPQISYELPQQLKTSPAKVFKLAKQNI